MKRVTNPVPLADARARLLAFRKRHGKGLHKANTLADVIWPEQPFNTTQGAGAAASRVLKRLGCKWRETDHQWGWSIDNL